MMPAYYSYMISSLSFCFFNLNEDNCFKLCSEEVIQLFLHICKVFRLENLMTFPSCSSLNNNSLPACLTILEL